MTKELPSFACARCPVLPSHTSEGQGRALGWLASTSIAALLVSALGALAMTWDSEGMSMGDTAPIMIELPPAQAIEAISEPSPDPVDQLASTKVDSPDIEDTPDTPELTEAPDTPDETPVVEEIVEDIAPEVDQEPPPKPVVEVPKPKEVKPKEKKKEKKKAEAPKEKVKEPPKKKASEEAASSKASKAPATSSASAGAGSKAAQNYGGLVAKKVRSTKKKKAPRGEGGSASVSFTITDSGGLGKVGIAKSSGSAAVDEVAMDHIRRSAPFPPPPPGAKRNFSLTVKVQ